MPHAVHSRRESVPIGIVNPEQPSSAASVDGAAAQGPGQNVAVPQDNPDDGLISTFAAAPAAAQSTGLSSPRRPPVATGVGGALPPRGG